MYTPSILKFVLGVCRMEEAPLVADRAHLRKLLRAYPAWPYQEYADQIGRSYAWVKKWVKRLLAALPDDEAVLWSRSSARKHPSPSATTHQNISSARRVPKLFCITFSVTGIFWPRDCACLVPRAPSGRSYTRMDASSQSVAGTTSRWTVPSRSPSGK